MSLLLLDWLLALTLARPVRVLRLFRPALVFFTSRSTRAMFMTFVATLSAAFGLLWFIVVYILAFGLLGVLAFREWDGFDALASLQLGFTSSLAAFQTLWVYVCSNENYPRIVYALDAWSSAEAVQLPHGGATLHPSRAALFAFFVFHMVVSLFFVLAVVVALFYESYKRHRKAQALRNRIRERQCLLARRKYKTYTSIHIDTHVYKSTYTVSRGKVRPSPGPGP